MSKFLTLIQNEFKKPRLNRKPDFWYKSLLCTKVFNIAVLVAICLTGVIYLAKINNMATRGFKIKELEEKQAALEENIKKTELQVANLQSTQKIQERINNLDMASVAKVEYVRAGGTVAVK